MPEFKSFLTIRGGVPVVVMNCQSCGGELDEGPLDPPVGGVATATCTRCGTAWELERRRLPA